MSDCPNCDRLTRELDEERIMHAEVDAALKCEADERERLTREYEAYQRESSAENDRLRAALQQARTLLRSDSVEYDDLRNLDQILDAALSGEPASAVETTARRLRYDRGGPAPTAEQLDHARDMPLYRIGDAVLVWVNEGDLYAVGEDLTAQKASGEPHAD